MLKRVWVEELSEAAKYVWEGLRSFWMNDVWPVLMTVWIFLVFASPIILVILILWYLDWSGWRSGSGFYTIGSAALAPAGRLFA
jgi:hypothetical protein